MGSLNELISSLKKLPGVGKKSASRIAFHLIKQDDEYLSDLGNLIADLKKDLFTCEVCGNISSKNPCEICSDPLRNKKIICVVEDIEALAALEDAKVFDGTYHVIGHKILPMNNADVTDEELEFLIKHIKSQKAQEVIVATRPHVEGNITYYSLFEAIKSSGVERISRIAFGLPVGGDIEFADKITLHTALEARRTVFVKK